jgi:hypothetical protein
MSVFDIDKTEVTETPKSEAISKKTTLDPEQKTKEDITFDLVIEKFEKDF